MGGQAVPLREPQACFVGLDSEGMDRQQAAQLVGWISRRRNPPRLLSKLCSQWRVTLSLTRPTGWTDHDQGASAWLAGSSAFDQTLAARKR